MPDTVCFTASQFAVPFGAVCPEFMEEKPYLTASFQNVLYPYSKRYIRFIKNVYTFSGKGIYIYCKKYIPFRQNNYAFSYFRLLSISLRSVPGRKTTLLLLISEALNFASLSAPSLLMLT